MLAKELDVWKMKMELWEPLMKYVVNLDSLSKELVEEFLKFSNIYNWSTAESNKVVDNFIEKYNIVHSELLVSKNFNSSLLNRIINLERNALNNAQYLRKELSNLNELIFKRKELKSKNTELWALQFGQSLFINESICFENQVLFYKCCKLKNLGRLSAVCFLNNILSFKIEENGPISKINHVSHLEKLLKVDNIENLMFYHLKSN